MLPEAHPTNSASLQLSTWQGGKHDMFLAGAPLPAPLFPLGFTSHVQLQGPSTEWERAASAPLLPSIQTPLSCNEVNEVESFAALGRWWWEMEVTNRCFSPFPCSPSRVDGSGRCRLSCARLLGGGGEFGDGSSRWVTLLFAESKNGSLLLFLSTTKKKKKKKWKRLLFLLNWLCARVSCRDLNNTGNYEINTTLANLQGSSPLRRQCCGQLVCAWG